MDWQASIETVTVAISANRGSYATRFDFARIPTRAGGKYVLDKRVLPRGVTHLEVRPGPMGSAVCEAQLNLTAVRYPRWATSANLRPAEVYGALIDATESVLEAAGLVDRHGRPRTVSKALMTRIDGSMTLQLGGDVPSVIHRTNVYAMANREGHTGVKAYENPKGHTCQMGTDHAYLIAYDKAAEAAKRGKAVIPRSLRLENVEKSIPDLDRLRVTEVESAIDASQMALTRFIDYMRRANMQTPAGALYQELAYGQIISGEKQDRDELMRLFTYMTLMSEGGASWAEHHMSISHSTGKRLHRKARDYRLAATSIPDDDPFTGAVQLWADDLTQGVIDTLPDDGTESGAPDGPGRDLAAEGGEPDVSQD